MTWLVWRQHRIESLIALGVLALVGVFLLITGLEMANSFQQLGLGNCQGPVAPGSTCANLELEFANQYDSVLSLAKLLLALPLLLGALVGAPLVAREVEQRTHLLVWTQSITRTRWLSVKLAPVLAAGLLAAGAMLALLIWWNSPSAQVLGSFDHFDLLGPVWLAAALLALTLGVFAGALTRRVILAIFLTIALFIAIRVPVVIFLRPNFEPPMIVTWPIAQENPPATVSNQDWQIDRGFIDAQGNKRHDLVGCPKDEPLEQCLRANGAQTNYLTYQPGDRFWTFQWIETGIYVAFSVLALFAAVWLVRRRLN